MRRSPRSGRCSPWATALPHLRPRQRPGGRDGRVPGGIRGMALNLESDNVGVVIFGNDRDIKEGDTVKRTGASSTCRSAKGLLAASSMRSATHRPVRADSRNRAQARRYQAPGIIPRRSVHEPMQTGLKAIDALIPIGRGQRELIIATVRPARPRSHSTPSSPEGVNQSGRRIEEALLRLCRHRPKRSTVAQFVKVLEENAPSTIRSSSRRPPPTRPDAIPGAVHRLHHGRVFRDRRHACARIVYDDLSKHAVGLPADVAPTPPPAVSREAYPGDVFYLHSRPCLSAPPSSTRDNGSGSLTALPHHQRIGSERTVSPTFDT